MNEREIQLNNYVFDGQVYAQRMTGQYRYADEILKEFDKLVEPHKWKIIVPKYVDLSNKFQNIDVVYYGNVKGILWTQLSLPLYLYKHKAISVGFCNITPLLKPGMATVHDIGYKVLKKYYRNLYGRLSSIWHRINYWVIAKGKKDIITVSEFCRQQISDVYNVSKERIEVIGNGWQHYKSINEDQSIFQEYDIIPGQFYFALGSLEERKNFKWIIEVAKRHPKDRFVIAGGSVKNAGERLNFNSVKNILFVGYISDEKAKCLMHNCKAFLFPSTFEGFGIPPLEALSVGSKVLCSNAACLPEICADTVVYFNPEDYEINLEHLIEKPVKQAQDALSRYSWSKSAEKLKRLLT